MRVSVDNGNGCMCDICSKILLPKEAYKISIKRLSDDPDKARTGYYINAINSKDLCSSCYDKILSMFY